MSTLKLTAERTAHEEFARNYSVPAFRGLLDFLYAQWHQHNESHFGGALLVPHIGVGATPPRRYSQCALTTAYGGTMCITVSEGIAFGTNRRLMAGSWPAAGAARFLSDLVLGETVKQFALEVLGVTEEGYGGYGPAYAREATRIGATLGLTAVPARRRGPGSLSGPVAALWPWAFRPPGYYLGQVRLDALAVAGRGSRKTASRSSRVPGVFEYLLALLVYGRTDRLRAVLEAIVDGERTVRQPALADAERGPSSAPDVRTEWVTWNHACVARMAAHVLERREFDVMPILADALEDAGCDLHELLEHCRQRAEHTANCWALRAIRNAAESSGVWPR